MPDLREEPGSKAPPRRPVMVFYATRDGQSRRISARVADRLAAQGIAVSLGDSAGARPAAGDLACASVVVLVAAVRYGRHLPEALRFLAGCRTLGSASALALASVNLTARRPGKGTAEGNPYLQKLIARTGCRPAIAAAFAGRLDYPRYRWLDRQIIRAIMWLTGGPTDPRASVEYTAWDSVDAFAAQIAELHARQTVARPQQGSLISINKPPDESPYVGG
jgi:menaquinone-dependent protoporphyrinogen oxidase